MYSAHKLYLKKVVLVIFKCPTMVAVDCIDLTYISREVHVRLQHRVSEGFAIAMWLWHRFPAEA